MPDRTLRPSRSPISWATDNPKELARQLNYAFTHLRDFLGGGEAALDIIDGTVRPPQRMPTLPNLQFEGNAVRMSTDRRAQKNIAAIGYRGLDGVDVGRRVVRSSRDFVTDTISGTDQVPSPTDWDTIDYFRILGSGSSTVAGFPAPTTSGTRRKVIMHAGGTAVTFTHANTAAAVGERLWTPGEESFEIGAGDSFAIDYEDVGGVTVWRVTSIGRSLAEVPEDHDDLANRDLSTNHPRARLAGDGFAPTTTGATTGNPLVKQSDGTIAWNDVLDQMDFIGFNGAGSLIDAINTINNSTGNLNLTTGGTGDIVGSAADDISFTAANDWVGEATDGNMVLRAPGTGHQVGISANAEVDLTAPTLDLNGTSLVDIDGDNVFVGGTTEIDLFSPLVDINGTTLVDIDGAEVDVTAFTGNLDLAAAGEINLVPGTVVDFNNFPASKVQRLELHDDDSNSGLPDSGYVEVSAYSGPDSTNPGGMLAVFSRLFLWQFPIACEIDTSAVNNDTVQASINFASIRGYNLTDRIIRIRVHLQSFRTDSSDISYGGQDHEHEFTVNTNTSSNAHEAVRYMGNASGDLPKHTAESPSDLSPDPIVVTATSSTAITVTGTILGAGTRSAMMVVEILFCYL